MKKLLFAMAIGAALAWLFDPDAGSKRRDMLRDKLEEKRSAGRPTSVPAPAGVVQDAPGSLLTAAQ